MARVSEHEGSDVDVLTVGDVDFASAQTRSTRARHKVLTLQGAMLWETGFDQTLCTETQRFSLDAAVRCAADERQALERLCRTIARPALSNARAQSSGTGRVVLKLN